MITLEQIAKNLIGKRIEDIEEAFEDYSYCGETSVITSQDEYTSWDYQVYVDHISAPIIGIKLDNYIIIETDIL